MMKEEFERLAGYEVSFDDYQKIIEPMYIAADLDKQEFVKCINKNRFALPTKKQLIDEMKKIAVHLFEIYHTLGGNGMITKMKREIDELHLKKKGEEIS